MNKRKPRKGLVKRFKVTARGKLKHHRGYAGHLMSNKPGKRRRKLRRTHVLEGRAARAVLRMMGLA